MSLLIIQNCEAEPLGRYERYLQERRMAYEVFRAYRGGAFPPADAYELVLVGGTPLRAVDADQHAFLQAELRFLERLVRLQRPCLGICCGGQLLARVLGARVVRNPVMEIGVNEMRRTAAGQADPILLRIPDRFPAFQWHQDVIEIPDGAIRLVEGEHCPNQMFRFANVFGIIIHLEVSAQEARLWASVYEHELPRVGKSGGQVVRECAAHEPQMQLLADRLLDNVLAITAASV